MNFEFTDGQITKTKDGFTLNIQKHFSDIIIHNNLIVALDKKRRELFIYDSDSSVLKKLDKKVDVLIVKHQTKEFVIAILSHHGFHDILILRDKNDYFIVKSYHPYLINVVRDIRQISKYTFLITATNSSYLNGFPYYEICGVLNVKKKKNVFEGFIRSYEGKDLEIEHHNLLNRFFVTPYHMYDLYSVKQINKPYGISTAKEVKVCFSSKDIFVLKVNDKYYVYIKGQIVHAFSKENYEEIVSALKNTYKTSNVFNTVLIEDNMYIWRKSDEKLQVVSISKK